MKFPIKQPESFAPMQRSRECDREQNRSFRRSSTHMTEGQRRVEMRRMYIEIGKFSLCVNDQAIQKALVEKYRPYTRLDKPESKNIKQRHREMCEWYDDCRSAYMIAHQEDTAKAADFEDAHCK